MSREQNRLAVNNTDNKLSVSGCASVPWAKRRLRLPGFNTLRTLLFSSWARHSAGRPGDFQEKNENQFPLLRRVCADALASLIAE